MGHGWVFRLVVPLSNWELIDLVQDLITVEGEEVLLEVSVGSVGPDTTCREACS